MSRFLREEAAAFWLEPMVIGGWLTGPRKATYSILLRSVRVVNNKSLFGSSDVIVYAVVLDGHPGRPFWAQQFAFVDVTDGATLGGIDPDLGVAIYQGQPRGFLNLYLMVVRDKQGARDLAEVLSNNLVAGGLGTLAGVAISTHEGLSQSVSAPMARELCTKAVETTLEFFSKQKNPVIGVYYASLLAGQCFGEGMHPGDFPPEQIQCGDALDIAYEVRADEPDAVFIAG